MQHHHIFLSSCLGACRYKGSLAPCSANPCTCLGPNAEFCPSHITKGAAAPVWEQQAQDPLHWKGRWPLSVAPQSPGIPSRPLPCSLPCVGFSSRVLECWTHTTLSPSCSRAGVSSSRHIHSSSDVLRVVNFSLPRLPHPPPVPPPYGHS